MASVDFKLYMISGRHQTQGRSLIDVLQAAAEAGVSAVQFREKDLSMHDQYTLAKQVQEITKKFGVKLLINDRIDLCLAINADGIHLPSSGLPIKTVRGLLGPEKLIAVSCHSEKEVEAAEYSGADFAVLGPVFDTPSKRPFGPPLTLDTFQKIKSRHPKLPLFAIGGIHLSKIRDVFSAGADGIAMISAISMANDIHATTRHILDEIHLTSDPSR